MQSFERGYFNRHCIWCVDIILWQSRYPGQCLGLILARQRRSASYSACERNMFDISLCEGMSKSVMVSLLMGME